MHLNCGYNRKIGDHGGRHRTQIIAFLRLRRIELEQYTQKDRDKPTILSLVGIKSGLTESSVIFKR